MSSIALIALWIVVIGVVVGLVVWLGPRPSQWRAKQGEQDHDPENPETADNGHGQ